MFPSEKLKMPAAEPLTETVALVFSSRHKKLPPVVPEKAQQYCKQENTDSVIGS